jgi:hypothetical protein
MLMPGQKCGPRAGPFIVGQIFKNNEEEPQQENDDEPHPMRRSQRKRRSAIPNDYVVYMSEDINDIEKMDDPTSYKEAMKSKNSLKWRAAMEEELKSMSYNDM